MNRGAAAACLPGAFEERHRADPDPWRFASAGYERERYRITLAALTRDRYGDALRAGMLHRRADRLTRTPLRPAAGY